MILGSLARRDDGFVAPGEERPVHGREIRDLDGRRWQVVTFGQCAFDGEVEGRFATAIVETHFFRDPGVEVAQRDDGLLARKRARRADTAADYLVPKIGVFGVFGVPGPVGVRFQAGPQFLDRLEMGLFQGVLPLGGFALEAGRELAGEAVRSRLSPSRRGPSSLWCRLGSRP